MSFIDQNFSYYLVPVAWIVCFAPKRYSMRVFNERSNGRVFDTVNPRQQIADIKEGKIKLDDETRARILRADAAQLNGFENMGLFAAAVVAANVAGVSARSLNLWSITFIVSRGVHSYAYINGAKRLRGICFGISLSAIFGFFIQAGNAAKNVI